MNMNDRQSLFGLPLAGHGVELGGYGPLKHTWMFARAGTTCLVTICNGVCRMRIEWPDGVYAYVAHVTVEDAYRSMNAELRRRGRKRLHKTPA